MSIDIEQFWNIKCPSCKQKFTADKFVEAIQRAANNVIHIRGECPYCRSFVKWVPYRDSSVIKALVKAFYKGDLESIIKLRDTTIYDEKEKEIR